MTVVKKRCWWGEGEIKFYMDGDRVCESTINCPIKTSFM
jgi:hypothetical protein